MKELNKVLQKIGEKIYSQGQASNSSSSPQQQEQQSSQQQSKTDNDGNTVEGSAREK